VTYMAGFAHSKSYRIMTHSALIVWCRHIGDLPLTALQLSTLKAAVAAVAERLSPKSVNNYLTALRNVLDLAVADGWIPRNLAHDIPYMKVQTPEPDPFTLDEADLIVADMAAHYDPQIANYFETAFSTGMRPSELILVGWPDYDAHRRRLRINKARVAYEEKTTKTNKVRWIDLNDRAQAAIERQRQYSWLVDDSGPIFYNPVTGRPWSDPGDLSSHYWRPCLKRLRLRPRDAYNARHTYATVNLMAGVPAAYVSKQLGHASLQTTLKYYFNWVEGADRGAAAEASNRVFGQSLVTKSSK
jgi:integrase